MTASTLVVMLAIALAAVLAATPSPAPQPTPTPAPPPVIEGSIRGPAGVAVRQALVVAREVASIWGSGAPPVTTRTDQEGRFRILLTSSAPVDLRVQAEGLAPKVVSRVFPGKRLEIILDKGRLLQGVVRDGTSGKPIAGARVESFTGFRESTLDQPEGLRQAVTDAGGRFKLEGLGAGPVTVAASRPGYGRIQRAGVLAGTPLELLLQPGASILGLVRGSDGKGVSAAFVQAEGEASLPPPEITGADGRFELVGVKPGTYRVWAHRPGLGTSLIEEATLEGEADTRITLQIDPAPSLEGRLVAPAGKPLAGKLWVMELDGSRTDQVSNVLKAESAADGRFRLRDLPPGSHALAVSANGFTPRRIEVTLPAGRAETVDLGDIELERGLTIRGHVVDKAGSAVASAKIVGWRMDIKGIVPEAISDADGSFVLPGLQPGGYSINVAAAGYGGLKRAVEAGAENVVLALQPAGTITGQVVDERGTAVEAFRVSAQLQREATVDFFGFHSQEFEGSGGRFTFEDVAEGAYRVEASAQGKQSGFVKDVAVKPGATIDAGRIRLETGGVITGVVVDTRGAPVAGATVVPKGTGLQRDAEASSGLDGSFEIQAIPSGVLEVFASHPDFAAGKSEPLTVDPDQGPATTRIVLSAGGRIEGHVRRRHGAGLSGRVNIYSDGLGQGRYSFGQGIPISAIDGSFVVEHAPVGRTTVEAEIGDLGSSTSRSKQVTVAAGESTTVELTFSDVLVSGRVTRSGEPVPSVRVRLGNSGWSSDTGPLAPRPGPKHGVAVTDADGSYELIVDVPGNATVRVESIDYRTNLLQRGVEIQDSDTFALDLVLAGAPVSGTVVDQDTGDSIELAYVAAHPRKAPDEGVIGLETGPDGRFAMEVAPGEYKLVAQSQNHAQGSVDLSVDPAGVADVRIALSRGKRIEGKIVDGAGRGVGGAQLRGTSGDPSETATPGGFAGSESDGSFSMKGLLDRPYDLFGGTLLDGFVFAAQVPAGQTDVALTLRPWSLLRVTVKGSNGLPVEHAYVRVTLIAGHFISGGPSSVTGLDGTTELKAPQGPIGVTANQGQAKASAEVDVSTERVATLEIALPGP
jgi:protocatechuate 3,4-dioxygenase beta subunit